jgi:hypothetical protein
LIQERVDVNICGFNSRSRGLPFSSVPNGSSVGKQPSGAKRTYFFGNAFDTIQGKRQKENDKDGEPISKVSVANLTHALPFQVRNLGSDINNPRDYQ